MSAFIDRTGQRHGRLVVLERRPNRGARARWLCRCDCGNTKVIGADAMYGSTLSCGCLAQSRRLPPAGPAQGSIAPGQALSLRIFAALADGPLQRRDIAARLPDVPRADVYSRVSVMTDRGQLAKTGGYPATFSAVRRPYRAGAPTRQEARDPLRCARPRAVFALQRAWAGGAA